MLVTLLMEEMLDLGEMEEWEENLWKQEMLEQGDQEEVGVILLTLLMLDLEGMEEWVEIL